SVPLLSKAPPTSDIYTLSLHDALPILRARGDVERRVDIHLVAEAGEDHGIDILESRRLDHAGDAASRVTHQRNLGERDPVAVWRDRKSTRLNSSHLVISYAVFCLKKKK